MLINLSRRLTSIREARRASTTRKRPHQISSGAWYERIQDEQVMKKKDKAGIQTVRLFLVERNTRKWILKERWSYHAVL